MMLYHTPLPIIASGTLFFDDTDILQFKNRIDIYTIAFNLTTIHFFYKFLINHFLRESVFIFLHWQQWGGGYDNSYYL